MAVANELGKWKTYADEDLTEEEIEELITGAINWEQMINLGVIKSEDNSKTSKNPSDNMKMVTMKQFKEVLNYEVKENKGSKVKAKRTTKS